MTRVKFGGLVHDVKLVCFDKDGTLIDLEVWKEVLEARRKRLHELFPGREREIDQALFIDENGKYDFIKFMNTPRRDNIERIVMLLNMAGERVDYEMIDNVLNEVDFSFGDKLIRPIKGAVEVVNTLRKAGVKVYVVTADGIKRANYVLEKAGIEVDFVVGSDNLPWKKPAYELLVWIAEKEGIVFEEIAVVGDTPNDIKFAHGKALAVGVRTGFGSIVDLESYNPDVIMDGVWQIEVLK